MGNPLSKGPIGEDAGKTNNLIGIQFRENVNASEPVRYKHSLAVIGALKCSPSNFDFNFSPQQRYNNLNSPNFCTQKKELQCETKTSPCTHILDFTTDASQLGVAVETIVTTTHEQGTKAIPNGVNVEDIPFRRTYSIGTEKKTNPNILNPPVKISTDETRDGRVYEINLSPVERCDHQQLSSTTKTNENKNTKKEQENVSTFFKNGPKMAYKGRLKETKAAKRKREAAEMASTVIKRGKDDTPTVVPKDSDKYDCSDWEVPIDPFIKSYLDGGSSSIDETEDENIKTTKNIKRKPIERVVHESDSESNIEFQDEKETPRLAQMYKPSAKNKLQRLKPDSIAEPRGGKGSFGRFEAYLEERKKGKVVPQRDFQKSTAPEFEIMDPGDGEDEWGTPRVVEPPPETVVVPWVPYGVKKVVAEDGTVTYEQPDTVYEKFTQTNLGTVLREPMNKDEIEEYLRENKEQQERMLTHPSESSSSDSESTDSALYRSEESDDYEVSCGEFEKADENANRVYGIPTNFKPYQKTFEEENYLSDADENQPLNLRPTDKRDLKYLGDTVKTFRFENPSKDDEPLHVFEFHTTTSQPFSTESVPDENGESINKNYGDDYNDGRDENMESLDEYDDSIADVNKLIKDRDIDIVDEKHEIVTEGLQRLELKKKKGTDADSYCQYFEIISDSEENYEDDQVEEDYDDGLRNINLVRNFDVSSKLEKKVIRYDSDEDIDPSDESDTYDSEEDDYEDNVKELEYNDGIQSLGSENSNEDDEDKDDEPLDTEDEIDEQYEKYIGYSNPIERLKAVNNDDDYIDPYLFNTKEQDESDANDDDDDDDSDGRGGVNTYDGYGNYPEEDEGQESDASSETESDYDPTHPAEYNHLESPPTSDEDMVQDYNPVELLNELELQGDTFDNFPYSLQNGWWVDQPYKHPGDAKEAAYDRGEPGKDLPFWYFIKHPAEDDSLMNIRAKLADQYDNQTGPYNPFKVVPPPTPFWLDETFDLVPKGAKLPEDFYYGFMKPDPETLHQLELEEEDDDYDDDDDENYGKDVDGRSWRHMHPDEGPKRTWKSWRSRPEDGFSSPTNVTMNSGLRDMPEDPTQHQKVPKKNDQWQHYRDWLLRQGTKSVPKTTQGFVDINKRDSSKPNTSVSEGRFAGKKITERPEEKAQTRPHYQTWLTKQAEVKRDQTTDKTTDPIKKPILSRPHEVQNISHKHYEEAYVDDKWTETNHKPSENMWQHYQTWKQKDKNPTSTPISKPKGHFVFSKPPEDVKPSKPLPYSKQDIEVAKAYANETLNKEYSGIDQLKRSDNLDGKYSPKHTISESFKTQDKIHLPNSNSSPASRNTGPNGHVHPTTAWNIWHNPQDNLPRRDSTTTPSNSHSLACLSSSTPNDKLEFDGSLVPNNLQLPSHLPGHIFDYVHDKESKSSSKNNSKDSGALKYLAEIRTPTIRPKARQKKYLNKEQTPNSPFHIINIDDSLNMRIINQQKASENVIIDMSKPQEIVKNTIGVSARYDHLKGPTPSLEGSEGDNMKSHTDIKNSNDEANSNDTSEIINQTEITGTIKPKRKYTRRKPTMSNGSSDTNVVSDSFTEQVKIKRKYTRRSKPSLQGDNADFKSDNSNQEQDSQIHERADESYHQTLYTSHEKEPPDIVLSAAISAPPGTRGTGNEINTSVALNCDSNVGMIPDSLEKLTLNDCVVPNITSSTNSSSPSLNDNGELKQLKVEKLLEVTRTNRKPILPKHESKSSDPTRLPFHWKHYQTYSTKQATRYPIQKIENRLSNRITPPTHTVVPQAISKTEAIKSKVYNAIYSKPHGDHWNHYKTWLIKKGIQKLLYRTPTTRPVSTSIAQLNIMSYKRESLPDTISEKSDKPELNVNEADAELNEKVEYLHQRWLAWQQNLASKMVNKLNKMLKYYENPEGNIDHDTVKVRDMIKQRDYWREIHRWSSRKGFSLYNKTPPQTRPSVLYPSRLSINAKPQWPNNFQNDTRNQDRPLRSQGFQKWSTPDPDLLKPPPTISNKVESTKPSIEIKRPKFPIQSEPMEHSGSESRVSESRRYHRETGESTFRQELFNRNTSSDYADHLENNRKLRTEHNKQRQHTSKDEGMTFDETNQDKFFKEISDALGQSVEIEEKSKGSKSRYEKHKERRLKAKYQSAKKERANKKKGYGFLFKNENDNKLNLDDEYDFLIEPATEEENVE